MSKNQPPPGEIEHQFAYVLKHMVDAVNESTVKQIPSPNLYIENILPSSFYAEVIDRLPDNASLDFIDHPDAYSVDGRRTRKLLALDENTLERISLRDRDFWRLFTSILTSPELQHAVLTKFNVTLEQRFAGNVPDVVAVPIIYRDFGGYRIGIHPDSEAKIATLQIYLPRNSSQSHLGTTFHERTAEGFKELFTNPFLPNSAYSFVRTDYSWHSVKELAESEEPRNSIALTYYLHGKSFVSPPKRSVDLDKLPFSMPNVSTIETPAGVIRYVNEGSGWRFETLLTKEPETIEWINNFSRHDSLWDVGANVGVYSIYAALLGHKVVAFEPHFANYYQLCLNIKLNCLEDLITPLCVALSSGRKLSTFNLASTDFGSALSSFDSALDFRGNRFDIKFKQGMIGVDADSLLTGWSLEPPTHLKIDVDGIELAIVQGATSLLKNPKLESVSIELIETDISQVSEVTDLLDKCGLEFIQKLQNPAFKHTSTGDVLNYHFKRRDRRVSIIASLKRRDELASLIPRGGIVAELGVCEGRFSERLLELSQDCFLYSIDMWAGDRGHDVEQYRIAINRLEIYKSRNSVLRMRFDEAILLFKDETFDLVYVDGYAHTGEEDGTTFTDWWPKVKRGGILAGHDYHPDWPKTVAAVDRFVAQQQLVLHVLPYDPSDDSASGYPSWILIKPKH